MRTAYGFAVYLAATAPALAGDLPDWFTIDGRLTLGASDRTTGADAFLVGDATMRFQPASFGPFGAELGVYGRADALDTPHETYGALTWDFGPKARLSLGVPRPAYDEFAVSALEKSFPSLGIDRTLQTRSAATFGAMFAHWLPYGASLSGQSDTISYALSVHSASNPGATVVGVGAGTEFGQWALSGALEFVDGDVSAKAQAAGQFSLFTAGLGFFAPGAAGVSDLVEGFASVTPVEALTLSAIVQVPTDGVADPTAGLAARYGFNDHAGVSLGVATDAGSDAVFSGFLEWTF